MATMRDQNPATAEFVTSRQVSNPLHPDRARPFPVTPPLPESADRVRASFLNNA
jgi:hypothetical protein